MKPSLHFRQVTTAGHCNKENQSRSDQCSLVAAQLSIFVKRKVSKRVVQGLGHLLKSTLVTHELEVYY